MKYPQLSLLLAALALLTVAGRRAANASLAAAPPPVPSPAQDELSAWVSTKFLGIGAGAYASQEDPIFNFTYDGEPFRILSSTWHVERTSLRLGGNRTQLTSTYTDPVTGLVARCVAIVYSDFPTVEWTVMLKNNGASDTPIIENLVGLDASFPIDADANTHPYEVLHGFDGGYNGVGAYRPSAVTLWDSSRRLVLTPGGRGSDRIMPYFNLEYNGGGAIVAIGWPGQWKAEFTPGENDDCRLQAGQELTHFRLHPGEEARTPRTIVQFWKDGDWIDAQNVWRRWTIAHCSPSAGRQPLAPLLAGYNWTFSDATAASQIEAVDAYASNKAGVDYLWMDAGWYPCQPNWTNVGTWEPDPVRFPKGIRAISDEAHAKRIETILWFEPERVTAGTWLWKNHPEWLLGSDPNTRLLNLGNPDARQWLTDRTDRVLREQGIDLYREDFNIDPLDLWRAADTPDRQGLTEMRYIEGHFAYWDELLRRHPGLIIDSCASGGRRNDIETLSRAVALLRSDDESHPEDDQGHNYGFAFLSPYQGGGTGPDPYRFASNMAWHITVGMNPGDPNIDWGNWRRLLDQWRRAAPYYVADYYPLTPYDMSLHAWMAWQYNRPEQGDGMIQAFRRPYCASGSLRVVLRGLDPKAHYRVTRDDGATLADATGGKLMDTGFVVSAKDRASATLAFYQRVGGGRR